MKSIFAGVALALSLVGCATVNMGDVKQDAALKTFKIAPDKSGVYIYRNESMGAAIKMTVELDGKPIGETAANTFLYTEVTPGKHTFTSKAENESTLEVDAAPGTLLYIWQEVKMGVLTMRSKLQLVDPAQGQKGVRETKLAETKGAGPANDGAQNVAVRRSTNRVLILSAAYVDPNMDTVGLNKLTENVTQAFSNELQSRFSAINKTTINVNDKTMRYSAGEKLAIHASKSDAEAAVVLSIDTPKINGQYSTNLKVQYFELRYMLKDGSPSSVIPTNGFERSYYLRGPQGDTTLSFGQIADNFIADLPSNAKLVRSDNSTGKEGFTESKRVAEPVVQTPLKASPVPSRPVIAKAAVMGPFKPSKPLPITLDMVRNRTWTYPHPTNVDKNGNTELIFSETGVQGTNKLGGSMGTFELRDGGLCLSFVSWNPFCVFVIEEEGQKMVFFTGIGAKSKLSIN
jgi:hypothetical protein